MNKLTDQPTASAKRPASAERPAISEDELVKLLSAYHFLEGQNFRMETRLSAQLGLGIPDMRVLLFLDATCDATPKDVGAKVEQTSGSITALLDRLENSGHMVRRPHPTDRRRLTLHLTESGHNVVDSIQGAYRNAFTDELSSDEISSATQTLRALGRSLDRTIDAPMAHDNDA